jgi:hypothetical protein
MSYTPRTRRITLAAIAGLQDRAKARAKAAEELDMLSRQARNGLVKQALQDATCAMLREETQFLALAEKLRNGDATMVTP